MPRRWRSKFLWKRDRGLSPPAIHIQSLRDYEQASRLRYKDLDFRVRGDDIMLKLIDRNNP